MFGPSRTPKRSFTAGAKQRKLLRSTPAREISGSQNGHTDRRCRGEDRGTSLICPILSGQTMIVSERRITPPLLKQGESRLKAATLRIYPDKKSLVLTDVVGTIDLEGKET